MYCMAFEDVLLRATQLVSWLVGRMNGRVIRRVIKLQLYIPFASSLPTFRFQFKDTQEEEYPERGENSTADGWI